MEDRGKSFRMGMGVMAGKETEEQSVRQPAELPQQAPGASRHGLPGRDDPDWLRDKPGQAPRSESRSRYSGKMGLFIT